MRKATASTTISRILKWSFLNFWRNRMQSIAATLVMTLTLLTVSIFVILNLLIGTTIAAVQQKIDLIIYFNEIPTESQINLLQNQIQQMPEVSSIHYVNKAEALQRWQARNISADLKNIATSSDNPLPRSFEIKAKNVDDLSAIAAYFNATDIKPMVEKTSLNDNQATITKLINATKFIKKMGLIFSGFFILISILVIFNTIRLAIFSRRDEVEIMKLVGATDSAIRWPFILEGMFYGLLGTIVSTLLLVLGFKFLSPIVSRYLGDVMTEWGGNLMSYFDAHLWELILLQLVVGLLIGSLCSVIAIRKHLRV
jgi:cell division transport system permease protein